MNLDLNLGPVPEAGSGSVSTEAVNLEGWVDNPIVRLREAVRVRARQRRRWRQLQMSSDHPQNLSVDLNQLIGDSGHITTLQAGEGSVAAEERTNVEEPKMCENSNGFLLDEPTDKTDEVEKGNINDGSFFDCNICLDLAADPVVTCCGHLFCWPCLYQWLHIHSDAKECPVCKGEVSMKNVTPIYGRGSTPREHEEDSSLEIPSRPRARRVESLRQTIHRNPFSFSLEEMIRRLGRRIDLSRDMSPPHDSGGREAFDRATALQRLLLRGMRDGQAPLAPPDGVVDLTESSPVNSHTGNARRLHTLLVRDMSPPQDSGGLEAIDRETALQRLLLSRRRDERAPPHLIESSAVNSHTGNARRLPTLIVRRSQTNFPRSSTPSSMLSAFNSAERLVDAHFENLPPARSQEHAQLVDDRDSFSSIAAINSESQTDTAVEIDSMVSLSTSRRRHDSSRVSDVDSEDSRAARRRRLN